MKQTRIEGIFATPVMISNLNRDFTPEELAFFQEIDSQYKLKNYGNSVSLDNYVLNHPEMETLRLQLLDKVSLFVRETEAPSKDVDAYVTQSWINYTEKGGYHHRHSHQNSYISGVIYLDADATYDSITFYRKYMPQITIDAAHMTPYNSQTNTYSVSTGDVVLFPSWLEHEVGKVIRDETRVSLAFNVFLKGDLGSNKKLTELIL